MKLSVWLLFVLIIPVSATSYSQNKKLTHAFKNSSLKEVFQLIEEELDYSIVYKDELIGNHLFSGHFQNANAPEVLDRVLEGKPLAYKTVGEIILIIPKGNEQVQVQNVITVTGTVTDAYGEPLPGVNVYDKNNSTNGVITNIDGQYTITVKNESILKFSFIGFADQEIEVAGRTSIKVTLVEETTNLEEVVAVGYGTMKKANLIGSVSKINSEAIAQKPVANVTQALQGASANLILQQPTMEPGTSASINIRGVSTMNNNSPLVVIDGLVGGDLNSLNPADIESVSILKDAGSAAIYGSRSANGVILVTTKKGNKKGKPTVTATAQVGIQDVSYEYRPVAGYKNAMLRNEALANVGSAPLYSPDQIRDLKENGDSEWFLDQILRNAMQENYSFNMSGGNDNSTYMVSAGYMNQENNFVGDDYGLKRYNFRMNMTNEYGKFKLITNMAYSRTLYKNHTTSTNNLIVDASRIPNYYYYQMKDASGRYYINDVLTEFSPLGIL
ncbi:MAG: SusC/RagA family TonB-linked outer membrane protein, partial [Carboxylicivirga sp.]|nr:SusC/RagA family TonB-linked outer membrane protein [Carboxylicivirga sp.]